MKIALVGATGFVGTAILRELLDRKHEVLAIARNPDKIEITDGKLTKKAADAFETEKLAEVLAGADAVVSAYNAGWTNPNIYNDIIKGSLSIQEAVKQSGVKRFIYVGGAGTLQIDGNQVVDSPQFPAEYKIPASAVRDYYRSLKEEKELDWVFFSPAMEMHPGITTGRTGNFRLGKTSPVFNAEGRSILSVEDLAMAIVDELENNTHHQEQFTAAY